MARRTNGGAAGNGNRDAAGNGGATGNGNREAAVNGPAGNREVAVNGPGGNRGAAGNRDAAGNGGTTAAGGTAGRAAAPVDASLWEWLPQAAHEVEVGLRGLLSEASINAHDVTARAKRYESFVEKCRQKGYTEPLRQVTDTVAVRLIMYSATDRERASELVRERFELAEDLDTSERDTVSPSRRGYDSTHLVAIAEREDAEHPVAPRGSSLDRYFRTFGGLEIQIRTVAAHAWAEFEHSRRYKGEGYKAVGDLDRLTIDQLFGAAADARHALDEIFVAIDRVLANPAGSAESDHADAAEDGAEEETTAPEVELLDVEALTAYLAHRFPEDSEGSERGVAFALELVQACGLRTVRGLDAELSAIDGAEVRRLMDTSTTVTRVRRLDDELLAVLGEEYIERTASIGNGSRRGDQLRWRYDRLRGKVTVRRRTVTYQLFGADVPADLTGHAIPAVRAVREVARIVATVEGSAQVVRDGAISRLEDLPLEARARPVRLADGTTLWVATALGRRAAERLLEDLLDGAERTDVRVLRNGEPLATGG
ncbi:hypothetical protein NLU66_04480 [Brachybacterium sp. NBEC-018]|uniref:GTP pyrophosphokinase n=1 Tax=Brachybacterium sp. NBEC-018 TaxID=2996004 RepID=UPI00217535CF|nr:hypothetical protein [Brachybacterium sp. NBEC-018]UVY84859.1 hypothetical protein NLU66_04480 [Brachybacterium sp. NBEC-018]